MLKEKFVIRIYDEENDFFQSDDFEKYPTKEEVENFINKYGDTKFNTLFAEIHKLYFLEKEKIMIKEIKQDLFDFDPEEYMFAHCISNDMAMGAGIAKEFCNRYPFIKDFCKEIKRTGNVSVSNALKFKNVYNLITKENYWNKPNKDMTYTEYLNNLEGCLEDMREQMEDNNETKLAIPKLGCGLDRCKWEDVKEIIERVFENSDIEITVCSLE